MKERCSYLLIMFMLVLTLCSCKSGNSENDTTEPTTEMSIVEVTEEATEEVPDIEEPKIEMIKDVKREPIEEIILEQDFENGETEFTSKENASVNITDKEAYEGTNSLEITGRLEPLDSASVDMTGILIGDEYFKFSAWVKYTSGKDEQEISCMFEWITDMQLQIPLAKVVAKKGEWTLLEGDIIIPWDASESSLYFETEWNDESGEELTDLYIDNVKVAKVTTPLADVPNIYEAYKDYFDIGVSIVRSDLMSKEREELVLKHFNTITTGNELKPDSVLDYETCISDEKYDTDPAVKFDAAKPIMDFVKENGLKMRGHTLVWHSQTPRWFFTEDYSKDAEAPLASKEKMLLRMENYIKNVFEYINQNYPGMFYAWDVVNEAINNDGAGNGYRSKDSLWYQIIGEEFVEKAFEYARKYAEPEVKLFYNDYQEYDIIRRTFMIGLLKNLKDKGLIDGMGMQSHITMGTPTMLDYEETIVKYAEIGLEVQITELDMHLTTNSEEELMKQGERYQRIFEMLKRLKRDGVNITNVTFWGIDDANTWLDRHHGVKSYPLLFDGELIPKPAYWGVMGALE